MDYFCPQKSFDVCDFAVSCRVIAMTAACFDLFFCASLTEEKLCFWGLFLLLIMEQASTCQ